MRKRFRYIKMMMQDKKTHFHRILRLQSINYYAVLNLNVFVERNKNTVIMHAL